MGCVEDRRLRQPNPKSTSLVLSDLCDISYLASLVHLGAGASRDELPPLRLQAALLGLLQAAGVCHDGHGVLAKLAVRLCAGSSFKHSLISPSLNHQGWVVRCVHTSPSN